MANLRGPLLRPMRFRDGERTEDQIRELYNGIQDVAAILGHEKLDTTMKYVYIDKTNVKNAYRKFA